jgi:hypothetical protein
MPLNKTQLQTGIHQAFKKMQDSQPPENASEEELNNHFKQLLIDLATDLATTIDTYVKSGDVVNIQSSGTISVTGNPQTVTVNTTQTGTGRIQ